MTITPIPDTDAFVVTMTNLDQEAMQVLVSGDIVIVEQCIAPPRYMYSWEQPTAVCERNDEI